jgi:HSP20 family protein
MRAHPTIFQGEALLSVLPRVITLRSDTIGYFELEIPMKLVRIDPFREMEELSSRLNRFFTQPFARVWSDNGEGMMEWAPAVDIAETDKEYLLKADLPEVKKEDVKVEILNGTLSVQGERKQEKEEKGRKFHRIERAFGHFERALAIPSDVDTAKVSAEFKDGVLEVHLPKTPQPAPKAVEVKVG